MFHKWLSKQFRELGLIKEADSLAMHLLALSQGVATMATAFPSEIYIKQEVKQMVEWLDAKLAKKEM